MELNYHKTYYTDMFGAVIVASKNPTTHAGQTLAPGYGWSLGSNANDDVESWGLGVGLTFDLGMGYKLTGNYNHLEQKINYASEQSTFLSYFNTPENMYTHCCKQRSFQKFWILS